MRTTDISIPSLYGGVSRQPAQLRFPSQVENASNVGFSVVDGASKRPGTWFLREIADLAETNDYRLHKIIRDQGEVYIVVYGPGTLRVFELGGPEAAITFTDEATAYLNANNPTSDQLRLVSEADATFIVNTTVPVSTVPGVSYEVSNVWQTYEIMVTQTPPVGSYHRTLTDTSGHPAGYFRYQGFQGTNPSTLAKITFAPVTGALYAHQTGFYDNSGQGPFTFKLGFQRLPVENTGAVWDDSELTLTKAGAFADYEHQPGDRIYVVSGTGVTPGWKEITDKVNDDTITLTASLTGGPDQSDIVIQGIGVEANVSYPVDSPTLDSMHAIAAKFQDLIRSAGAPGALCNWTDTGVPAGPGRPATVRGYFTITSPYGGTGATITPPTSSGSGTDWSVAGTPFAASTAVVTPGTGASATNPEWLSVDPPNTDPGQIDATKMPIVMRRTGTSSPYPNPINPARFEVDIIEWNQRESGDENSNPIPRPWKDHLKIRDIKFWQDRMVLAMGEYVVCSRAGDYFNFFLEDHENLLDTDPVVKILSSEEITIIDYMVPFQKALVLYTQAGKQFQLTFVEVLTPSSVTITPATQYTTLPVRPRPMGSKLFSIGSDGYGSQLLEYQFDEEAVTSTVANASAHVPGYLPATARSMDLGENSRTVLILPNAGRTIYVYRAFWTGDQKQQSAWCTYDFETGYIIADAVVIEDYCYILVKFNDQWALERFSLVPEPASVVIEPVV